MSRIRTKLPAVIVAVGIMALTITACGGEAEVENPSAGDGLAGNIRIDGSSTVAPLTEAIAEGFQAENPDVKVTVGTSGTGGGFEKFCAGETDANDASSQIDSEQTAMCAEGGIEWEEIQVANDAVSVVVNPENPVECLTTQQLSRIWERGSAVGNWDQVNGLEPAFGEELALFGPGTDSGTFDYFTEAVNGEEGNQRKDYNNVGEDDNQTVTGVAGAKGGMGYFGFSFLAENEGRVRGLEIDGGKGCVAPSEATVQDGSYTPLSRPLFIYPSARALDRPEVDAFLGYYLENVSRVASSIGFIGLTDSQLADSKRKLDQLVG
ncbi:MAG: PstS family phosphate ABC transporter substrate-binding protein [Solirubrobacterales bacterium]|nr:PstS family phosphate ABC transporter substrate-binding protein [Solirubrobacterales bacterium]